MLSTPFCTRNGRNRYSVSVTLSSLYDLECAGNGSEMRLLVRSLLLIIFVVTTSCENTHNDAGDQAAQIIYRGNGEYPGTLDPALAEDIHAFNILIDLYEGLLAEAANGDLIPGVAESWAISDDGLVYTFQLRHSARWSNGDPVLASDFVRSLQRVVAPETTSAYAFLLDPLLNFAAVNSGQKPLSELGVSALSERRLEIRLANPANHWLAILAMPITFPTHVSSDVHVSNGAFTLLEQQAGGTIRLQKNSHYWGADGVSVDQVVYRPITDPVAEFNMYRAGELDITYNIPSEMVQVALREFGSEARISPALALYYIAFDLTEAPFDNAPLRKALNMAIDREQLVALLGRGEQPAFNVVPPGVAGFSGTPVSWSGLPNDVRKQAARKLYAEAGYSSDDPLQIRYVYDADDVHEKVALAVSAMWRDVLGVETTLDKREWKYLLDTRDQRGEWDVMRFAWFGDYNSPRTFLDIFQAGNEQNLSRYENPRFDGLLAASESENVASVSNELMQSAENQLVSDSPVIPLYFYVSKHMVKANISGFENHAMDRHASRFITKSPKP